MSETAASYESPQAEGPFEAALRALLAECEAAAKCGREDKATILVLAARVPAHRRAAYLSRLAALPPKADARGSDSYQKLIHFIDHHRKPEWKNTDLQAGLAAAGTRLDAKEIGNFSRYLMQCGRFERLARGHYRDRLGNVIVTSDELPTWSGPEASDE